MKHWDNSPLNMAQVEGQINLKETRNAFLYRNTITNFCNSKTQKYLAANPKRS